MATQYEHVRVIALPLVPDADPNTSPPPESRVFALKERTPSNQNQTVAHALFCEFDVPGGTLTFTAWERDAQSGHWVAIPGPVTITDRVKIVGNGVQNPDLFIQVTAVAPPGGATSVTLRVAEQSTNESLGYGAELVLGTVTANQGTPNSLANGWPVKLTDGVDVLGTVAHPLQVSETDTPATTSTVTDVPVSLVTVTLLAANAARLAATIFNDSNRPLTLKLGAAASAVSRTTKVAPQMEFNLDARYTGVITGFWPAGAAGSAGVTELTP